MNAIFRLAIVLALAGSACAGETGKVLLIDDDRLLEGEVARVGERFRIRGGGGEMTIPATPTMLVFADKDAAYRYLRTKAKPSDPLARVWLARWCLANQLVPQAIAEAEAALALAPDDRSLKRFVEETRLRATLAPPMSVTATKPAAAPVESEPAAADVQPESFSLFVQKVQPLLLNACGRCHCNDRGGSFKLTWTAATFGDKRATQLNLTAVSQFLNREQPSSSPLLVKSVTVHGETPRPPLKDRQSAAFRHLEEWVRLATGRPLAPALLPADAMANAQPLPPAMPGAPREVPEPVVLPALSVGTSTAKPAAETPKVKPDDPFDPEQFNRQNTPKK